MTGLYEDFEKRFDNKWFSAGWIEVESKPQEQISTHKDLATLEEELNEIKEKIETLAQKQLRLANLANMYNN